MATERTAKEANTNRSNTSKLSNNPCESLLLKKI